MANIIEVEGLTKAFTGSARAVDSLSFEVEEGQVFSLLGPNCAGKTTTTRTLTTMTSVTEIRAMVGGTDLREAPAGG